MFLLSGGTHFYPCHEDNNDLRLNINSSSGAAGEAEPSPHFKRDEVIILKNMMGAKGRLKGDL
jgi:hypothetical protein